MLAMRKWPAVFDKSGASGSAGFRHACSRDRGRVRLAVTPAPRRTPTLIMKMISAARRRTAARVTNALHVLFTPVNKCHSDK